MIRYFDKKSSISLFLSTLFMVIGAFIGICETDFISAIMQCAAYKADMNIINSVPGISSDIKALCSLGVANLSLVIFGVIIVAIIFDVLGTWLSSKFVSEICAKMRLMTYSKIQTFSFADVDKFSSASLVTRITSDVEISSNSLSFATKFIANGLCSIVFGIVKSCINYPKWAFTYAIAIPAIFVVMIIIIRFAMPNMKNGQIFMDGINKQVRETILGIRVVKAYNLEEEQKSKFEGPNDGLTKTWYKAFALIGSVMPIIQGIVTIVIASIYYVSYANYNDMAGAGQIIGFVGIMMQVLFGFIIIMVSMTQISRAIPSFKRINEVTSYKPSLIYPEESDRKIEQGMIEFKNVSHSFLGSSEHNILKNINLTIKPKERIGIIGGTGSGKSTLINLLGRLFDPTEGEVLIDGTNVKEFTFNEINSQVAIAMQTATLFSGTIKSNIAYGLPEDMSEDKLNEEILAAAKAAEAWEFISKKEGQLDAVVEQRGKNFSGGQKQRISIARTIAKKSKVVIFDDSTSALDTVTERKVQANMRHYNDATTIIVAQRISSVEELDRIIVMENGEVVGFDSHWNLLANNKTYRSIAASQLGTEELNETLRERGLEQIEKTKEFSAK